MSKPRALDPSQLRWHFDEALLDFSTTSDVEASAGIVGQPIALEALRFGLATDAPGQNVYVRGITGTGRMSMVRAMLAELEPKARNRRDRCYVHHFKQPDRPRLLTLPAGDGPRLRRQMQQHAEYIAKGLKKALESSTIESEREALRQKTQKEINELTAPLEKKLEDAGLKIVNINNGQNPQTALFPTVDGEPVPPDQFRKLAGEGKVTEEQLKQYEDSIEAHQAEFQAIAKEATGLFREGMEALREFNEAQARQLLEEQFKKTREQFPQKATGCFLDEVIDHVVEQRLHSDDDEQPSPKLIYGVNVVCTRDDEEDSPVVSETTPTMASLIGSADPEWTSRGRPVFNYQSLRAGALVHADGGYLILDARDVLVEPGAWKMLMRSLRTGCVEIVPSDIRGPFAGPSIQPEPIDINVRVILIGDSRLYYLLDQADQDFSDLFKVLADFNSEMERSEESVLQYARVLAGLAEKEDLRPFSAGAVAALAEHGARIAARGGKITARFGRISDIAREAEFLAGEDGSETVQREHVRETVRRTKFRASLPSQRFQELMRDGTIRVQTSGEQVGQINGLAVINAGPLTYGFPSRITATIGPGRAGVIDIEAEAKMSGNIHKKGFAILGGCLRYLLKTDHPMAFSASLAFEQSYGGIDGDSASGAEICCLISALTDLPINQGFAMTGAIDQHGAIQAIGGVNEKIEGFYDACRATGDETRHGVLIPAANADDLMLRADVVEACESGDFAVYAVADVREAMTLLMDRPAGEPDGDDNYPEGSILYLAKREARAYWKESEGNRDK